MIVRRERQHREGDTDAARQMFFRRCWDGNLVSKELRDRLVSLGYAVRMSGGMQTLTWPGRWAFARYLMGY